MGYHYYFHQYLFSGNTVKLLLDLFVWIIGFLFWVLPGQPEPNKYGYPPFMNQEPVQSQPITEPPTQEEQEVRKKGTKTT